ncbi:hypothetical protein [Corynebacterium striatum]|uniref:hypothetical protein n=1 Tax=Corynebacterium striatum TaxID=43770 RepID=UPI003B592D31
MNQTGVRIADMVSGSSALSRADRIAALRAEMRKLESPAIAPQVQPEVELVEAPSVLAKLLPGGGLARRQVVSCADCPSLIVEIVSHVSAQGGHVGIVGWPELSLAQVADKGDLSRVIVVPDPGADPWAVTGVLAEGLDVVIHRGVGEVTPSKARPVLAKIRGGQAAVLTVGVRLPGTATEIDAEVTTFRGLGRGSGRINGVDIAVRVEAKGVRAKQGTMTCGQRRRLEAV